MDRLDIARLNRAWPLIIDQFLTKAQDASKQEGPGISIFRMLRKPIDGSFGEARPSDPSCRTEGANCEYYYIDRETDFVWKTVTGGCNPTILSKYDPSSMFFVCVSVPTHDTGDETTQSYRLFEFDTLKEVVV